MNLTATFETLWRAERTVGKPHSSPVCPVARELSETIEEKIFELLDEQPTDEAIAKAKYLLQELCEDARLRVPGHHSCLDAVYHRSFHRLRLMTFTPRPSLQLLDNPSQELQRSIEIAGITFGLEDPV